jgi:MoaA/NifB/PqqE/SkfB family radical SAM enzyme
MLPKEGNTMLDNDDGLALITEIPETLAGTVTHAVEHSSYWSPMDPEYGGGGSPEYPLRKQVEKRIRPAGSILQLENPEVRIETTNHCNYTCIMCPRDKHDRQQGIMPMTFFRSVVDEVVQMGAKQITLTNFGEPFLDPTLEDKIFYATEQGLSTYVISNASLLHLPSKSEFGRDQGMTKMEAAISAGLSELRLSFYGTNEESYERVMKGGKFERTRENIRLFKEARERIGRKGMSQTQDRESLLPEVSIFFLDLPQNHGDLDEFLELTQDLCDYVEAWKPHNFGLGRENTYRDVSAPQPLKSCGRPQNGPVQINWEGIVVPCCYDYDQAVPLGNVALETVEEVLKGGPYRELRRVHETGCFDDVPYCQRCDQLREHASAVIYTSNPRHQDRKAEDIVKSPNTRAGFKLDD